MSQNLLVERLKYAKRELTALKTAHKRGLGLLKVYTNEYSITGPSTSPSEFRTITVTVNFNDIPYPLVGYWPINDGSTPSLFHINANFRYINNGYGAVFEDRIIAYNQLTSSLFFYSTSPISTIEHNWSES